MMKDPAKLMDALVKLGHDPRKLAESYLVQQLEEEMLDPKEKEFRAAKLKLQQYEEMERKQREQVEAQRMAELKAKYAKDYETQFIAALKDSGLPQNKQTVAEMAKYVHRAAKIGYKLSPSEAAQMVREDADRAMRSLYASADGEMLLKMFGDEVAQKILAARGAKVKSPESNLRTPGKNEQNQKPKERAPSNKRMSNRDWQLHKRGLK